ncbi:MAG: stage II sporulation protein P [Clostridia bacterium]|nr:stage II sporulation protein P [Clostridia bacterium]
MTRNNKNNFILMCIAICSMFFSFAMFPLNNLSVSARTIDTPDCFVVYDADDPTKVVFMKGDGIQVNDEYISTENNHYIIESVNEEEKTAVARFTESVKMPVFNIKKKGSIESVNASTGKRIGLYHTHNDECYNDADGTDSIYGKGGIHDIGASLKRNLEDLGISVFYSEDLHLPHDSGAYTRSEQTASQLLKNDLDAIFDIHRDATPRSEYITTVNGEKMSKVRMVIGSANVNSAINKEFALSIKAYADEVYPGLIKDIYIGKGNYNQQLSSKAMLFEMGTNLIEKDLVKKTTVPLAKTIDVVLYGTKSANASSLEDLDTEASSGDTLETGLVAESSTGAGTSATNATLWIILGSIGGVALIFGLVCVFSKTFRHKVSRFFSELFGGIFGKKKA